MFQSHINVNFVWFSTVFLLMSFPFIMKEFFKIKTGNFRFKVISDTHTDRNDYNPKFHVPHKIMQTKPLRFCVKYCFNVILCQKNGI